MAMERSRHHKRRRRRRIAKAAVIIIAMLVTGILLFWMYEDNRKDAKSGTEAADAEHQYRRIHVDGADYQYNTDLITVLLMGIDTSGEDMTGQSDFISLAVFDRGNKCIKLIEISRDSMVDVRVFDAVGNDRGWNRQHLTLAYAFAGGKEKGCLMTQEAVSRMFHGIPIVYYTAGNLSALPAFHNLVGELNVQIPDDSLEYLDESFKEGTSLTLTSENVELFVRSRDIEREYSNTGRMRRQEIYMKAYLEKLKTLLAEDFSGTVSRMEAVFSNTMTNIGLSEVSSFAEMAMEYQFDPEQDCYTVQGTDHSGEYHDEFHVDEEALQQLVLQIFYKKK
ncbi:MAG: LCP family protein [Eubacteriales bacterium]|nr:LCP family protein [Eubacteriales bacterium]